MVEFIAYEELGYIIDPPSDTKEVFIPSPPTMTTVKINPRTAIIYITGGKISEGYEKLDALKAYAEENKLCAIAINMLSVSTFRCPRLRYLRNPISPLISPKEPSA